MLVDGVVVATSDPLAFSIVLTVIASSLDLLAFSARLQQGMRLPGPGERLSLPAPMSEYADTTGLG
jgi:hypothetical protein